MNAKVIGMVSALTLLTACSPKEESNSSMANTSAVASSVESSAASIAASSSAVSSIGDATNGPESSVLIDTYWKLITLGSDEVGASPHQREAHLVFGADNRITGSDGCNSLSANYSIEGETLTLSEITATELACEEGAERADTFKNMLGTAKRFSIHADHLELRDETGLVLARFQAAAKP